MNTVLLVVIQTIERAVFFLVNYIASPWFWYTGAGASLQFSSIPIPPPSPMFNAKSGLCGAG